MKTGTLTKLATLAGLAAIVTTVAIASTVSDSDRPAGSIYPFTDAREQTIQFHEFNRTIVLTSEEDAVMRTALMDLKAPCCADRSALTCCCQCNMARSWWGLSKHLIANEGLGAAEVRTAVTEWFAFINPGGFSGNSCYTGRCGRPFQDNGCGGMREGEIAF